MRSLRAVGRPKVSRELAQLQVGGELDRAVARAILFWSQFSEPDSFGCRLWEGAQLVDGYGAFRWRGKPRRIHRIAWELTQGEIPRGALVCHACDVRLCGEPTHLFVGTPKTNFLDMLGKDREWFPGHRLSLEQRAQLHWRLHHGESTLKLANEFGITRQTVHRQRLNLTGGAS